MSKRRQPTTPEIAHRAGSEPPKAYQPGVEHSFPVGPETGARFFDVSKLSIAQLLELKQYLDQQRIRIRQKFLQDGVVSPGYAQRGAIQLEAGKIGFKPHGWDYIIVGTPEEFVQALRSVDDSI